MHVRQDQKFASSFSHPNTMPCQPYRGPPPLHRPSHASRIVASCIVTLGWSMCMVHHIRLQYHMHAHEHKLASPYFLIILKGGGSGGWRGGGGWRKFLEWAQVGIWSKSCNPPFPPGRTIWHVKYLDLVLTISTCIGCSGDLFQSGWTPCNWLRRVTQVTHSLFLFATSEKREQNYSQRRLLAWLAAAAAHSRKTCLLSSSVSLSLSLESRGSKSCLFGS